MQRKVLFIVRGVPGSGKTTFCQNKLIPQCRESLGANVINREADDYFVGPDGVYRWDPTKLAEAHAACQQHVREDLQRDGVAIVSNTSVRLEHLEPYFEMARQLEADVIVIRLEHRFANVHGVPEQAVDRMAANMEPYPNELVIC
ncbi:AAA family ATPase [bacterium]|nr:AAA family ATPase [bacterium]